MLPDFNRLKVFYFIYSSRSMVAAARELNITPSAVSQHLKKLEFELKRPLFTRLHKKLVPTTEADRLMDIVTPFVRSLETGLRSIDHARATPAGLLRVGAPAEFGKAYFPDIFAAFRRKYPEVTFSLSLGDPSVLLAMVREGRLDFALVDIFLTQSRSHSDLAVFSIEPIIDEEVILACSKEYSTDILKYDFSFPSLIDREFISYQESALELRGWFRHHFRKTSVHPKIVMTVDSLQAVMSSIRHHMGMGVIVSHLAYEDIRKGKIVPVTTHRKEIINRISLVQLQDKVPSLTDKTFQTYFRKTMQKAGVVKKFKRGVDV